jgi:uncharacterized protein YukE
MAVVDIQVRALQDSIGAAGGSSAASARGSIAEMKNIFDTIKTTALKLNEVWDDDAQRTFLDKFNTQHIKITGYLAQLDKLLGDMVTFSGRVADWDTNLTKRLNNEMSNR